MYDLKDFVNGLVPTNEKTASDQELEAFETLLAQADEEEKVAYGMMGGGSDDWLARFQHTPLYEKAIALKEKDLALEKRRMEERQRREKAYRHDDSTWNEQDKLCLEKDKLTLELHKWRASQEAKTKLKMAAGLKVAGNGNPLREHDKRLGKLHKKAELVEYTGHVNNGEPQAPEWPRAALGVDAANRRATPEELRTQTSVQSPDIQHVEPHSDGSDFSKKVSGLVVKLANARKKLEEREELEKKLKKRFPYAAGMAAVTPVFGGAIGGAIEGARKDDAAMGALRGGAGSLVGGVLGGIPHVLAHPQGAPLGALAQFGVRAGSALGAHLATRKYRKDDDSAAPQHNKRASLTIAPNPLSAMKGIVRKVPPPIPSAAMRAAPKPGPYSAVNRRIAEQMRGASPSTRERLASQVIV